MPTGVEASFINLSLKPDSGFRQFDSVDSFSDHHFATESGLKDDKERAKRISKEWSSLSTDLPEMIFVRVAEDRMDLLRAAMVGPAGTPYSGGLFFFDCYFPPQYPHKPPLVYYHSGGLWINPNLYGSGNVCLSLLGTWYGKNTTENWVAGESTMLQVLVSIQGLILNEKPFFNEPMYGKWYIRNRGVKLSNNYNEEVFPLSLKTMVYSIRSPPQHFADLVTWHFRRTGKDILAACKAYRDGASIDTVDKKFKIFVDMEEKKGKKGGKGEGEKEKVGYKGSVSFRKEVQGIMNILVSWLSHIGTPDIDEFRYDPNSHILIQDTDNTREAKCIIQ